MRINITARMIEEITAEDQQHNMSNGCTDGKRKTQLSILVPCFLGTTFNRFADTSANIKNATLV